LRRVTVTVTAASRHGSCIVHTANNLVVVGACGVVRACCCVAFCLAAAWCAPCMARSLGLQGLLPTNSASVVGSLAFGSSVPSKLLFLGAFARSDEHAAGRERCVAAGDHEHTTNNRTNGHSEHATNSLTACRSDACVCGARSPRARAARRACLFGGVCPAYCNGSGAVRCRSEVYCSGRGPRHANGRHGILDQIDRPCVAGAIKTGVSARVLTLADRLTACSELCIACRGSASIRNFQTNLNIGPVPLTLTEGGTPHPTAKVHTGFQSAAAALWTLLEPKLPTATDASEPVLVTGHSLGGGIATLLALHLHAAGRDAALLTVAGPRLGDAAFAQLFRERCTIPAVHVPSHAQRIAYARAHRERARRRASAVRACVDVRVSSSTTTTRCSHLTSSSGTGSDLNMWAVWSSATRTRPVCMRAKTPNASRTATRPPRREGRPHCAASLSITVSRSAASNPPARGRCARTCALRSSIARTSLGIDVVPGAAACAGRYLGLYIGLRLEHPSVWLRAP
jgi:pimeloyl-ACP methyl ester carboxylesterase